MDSFGPYLIRGNEENGAVRSRVFPSPFYENFVELAASHTCNECPSARPFIHPSKQQTFRSGSTTKGNIPLKCTCSATKNTSLRSQGLALGRTAGVNGLWAPAGGAGRTTALLTCSDALESKKTRKEARGWGETAIAGPCAIRPTKSGV